MVPVEAGASPPRPRKEPTFDHKGQEGPNTLAQSQAGHVAGLRPGHMAVD